MNILRFSKKKKDLKEPPETVQADRAWKILLSSISIGAVMVIFVAAYLFTAIDREAFLPVMDEQVGTRQIDQGKLNRVLEYFDAKAKVFDTVIPTVDQASKR